MVDGFDRSRFCVVASTSTPTAAGKASSARVLGTAVFVLGTATQVAWLALAPAAMHRVLEHGGMAFNTALLFTLAGGAVALPRRVPERRLIAGIAGVVVAALALMVLSQDLLDCDLGIDQLLVRAESLDARNHNPGRMAPSTAVALVAAGILLVALELWSPPRAAGIVPVLTFGVLGFGAIGLAQHALGLDFLYDWFDHPRTTVHAGLALLVLGAAFWLRWLDTPEYASVFAGREDRKLRLVEAGILVFCVVAAGVAAFGATLRETQHALTRGLSVGLDGEIARLERTVESERSLLSLLAAQDSIERAIERPDDPVSVALLSRVVGTRYWYVELDLGKGGRTLSIGARPNPELEVDFPKYPGSGLLYSGALALKIRVEARTRSGISAELLAIAPVPEIEGLLRHPHVLGGTAALNLCAESGSDHLRCFPSHYEAGVTLRSKVIRTALAPMARAVAGERGVSPGSFDTRGVPVLAAYAPIAELGLGAVLKVTSEELYRPIAEQLLIGAPVLIALIALGVFLLGSQVSPLVRSIVAAERQASRVTRALERKERHTQAILDGVSDGIVSLQEDSTIASLNPASLRLLGGTPEQLLGRPLTDFIVKRESAMEILRLCRDAPRELTERGDPRAHVVPLELERIDGSAVQADIAIDGIEAGEAFSVGVIRDTSRQRYVERMKDEFVATVSHELRTPLTAIRGALQLVMGGIGGPIHPSGNELLKIASGNLERLIQLVNDILDFEKIAAGKLQFSFRPRDLRDIVAETVKAMRAYAALHKVELSFVAGHQPVHVLADGERLNQAFTNLLSNAVKHSPTGETVEVRIAATGESFRVSVSDRGKGVPDSFRGQIFQPFAQADSSASRRTGGTGLGLSITKSIIERHRGRIDYTSHPGEGTTFFVELPACHAPVDVSPRSLPPGSLKARLPQILCIQEDAAARTAIAALLGDCGVVTGVEPDVAIFELPEDGPYDVVLLDPPRQGRLGSELARAAKGVGNFILVYTAHEDLLDDAVRALADDVLVKTRVSERDLKRRIEEILRNSGRFEKAVEVHAP